MIKAIIFDCFGVLTDDAWRAFRMSLPKEEGVQAQKLNHQYDAGLIDHQTFVDGVARITGRHVTEIAPLIDNETSKNVPLLSYIAQLKQHHKIGLLSNVASNWIRDTLLTPAEQALFDDMVFSYEEGITKPDPRIFTRACERLGVLPNHAVLIDDIETYCAAAQRFGMQAITYRDFAQMKRELEALLTM